MNDEPACCALPGCGALIEQPDQGGPRRLYCSAAHRAAARRLRHVARLAVGTISALPTAVEPPGSPGTSTGGALRPADDGSAATSVDPLDPASIDPAAGVTRPRPADGREADRPGRRRGARIGLRRRALVAIAAAGLVAGAVGYAQLRSPTVAPPHAQQLAGVSAAPPGADRWAGAATVLMGSLDGQLAAISRVERKLRILPVARRGLISPAAVQALHDREALLHQQRAAVRSQLSVLRALPEVADELSAAQAELDDVGRALAEPPGVDSSAASREVVDQLETQLRLHQQQRDRKAQELADLRAGVERAMAAPLPDPADRTAPVVASLERQIDQLTGDS